ncbi:hypothetical protein SAMN05192529_10132 [Arachidicoccus rhizosphaerae]|uniref:Lipoprotein n=1 Tax=Arachidicoccus rhizosphaerae TaxID=551991 RepID=A0A1H3VEX4_9BACT|nr:hypothetical protein [Arachidicoccus rhizosphaerae]SDZ73335.1 hypothetical protein SAMN05192529_10132 [Arachidicoccus rhizosphaerae]
MKNTSDNFPQKTACWPIGLLLISILVITGCKCNQGDQTRQQVDSLAGLSADSASQEIRNRSHQFTFDSLTTGWLSATMGGRKVDTAAFTSGHAPGFDPDSTAAGSQDAATSQFPEAVNFQPDQQYYKDYASVLRFSPDSSYILDFGSYGSIPVKGKSGRTTLEGGEPDTKIMVGIPGQHKEWQVMFAGPGTAILDATWKNDHQFMVLYASQQEGSRIDTTLIMGDMHTQTLHWFQLSK